VGFCQDCVVGLNAKYYLKYCTVLDGGTKNVSPLEEPKLINDIASRDERNEAIRRSHCDIAFSSRSQAPLHHVLPSANQSIYPTLSHYRDGDGDAE
jgi:hypothetical protein